MTTDHAVGSVDALWRFPVKSMQGEQLDEVHIAEAGVVGDRAYAIIDVETGKVASAKSVKVFPDLLDCRAAFVETPTAGGEVPPVRITLPEGTTVTSDAHDVDKVLSAHFGREVTLARAAPEDFTIDQYHPDIEEVDPRGFRDTVVEQKLGTAFFAEAGIPSPVAAGSFFDLFPVSLMTTSTLARLNALRPETRFDARRFRMNVIVAADDEGFVENEWVGREVGVGEAARVVVSLPDPRCVMTTLGQPGLPRDREVLRTLVQHNRLEIAGGGSFPCAGVYAVVHLPGTVRTGDPVALA